MRPNAANAELLRRGRPGSAEPPLQILLGRERLSLSSSLPRRDGLVSAEPLLRKLLERGEMRLNTTATYRCRDGTGWSPQSRCCDCWCGEGGIVCHNTTTNISCRDGKGWSPQSRCSAC